MADERETINVKPGVGTNTSVTNTEDRAKFNIEAIRSRFVEILDRGYYQDRTDVKLPPHLHGEWVLNDPQAIQQYRDVGFELDTEYSKSHGIMSNGDGATVFGDTVFMVCPREVKEVFDGLKRERYKNTYERRRDGSFVDETQALKEAEKLGIKHVEYRVKNDERVLQGSEITEAANPNQ